VAEPVTGIRPESEGAGDDQMVLLPAFVRPVLLLFIDRANQAVTFLVINHEFS